MGYPMTTLSASMELKCSSKHSQLCPEAIPFMDDSGTIPENTVNHFFPQPIPNYPFSHTLFHIFFPVFMTTGPKSLSKRYNTYLSQTLPNINYPCLKVVDPHNFTLSYA